MAYTPLSQKEVIQMHKDMYQSYTQTVQDFLMSHAPSVLQTPNIIRQLTYGVTLAHTYEIDTQETLEQLLPYISDFKALVEQTELIKTKNHIYKERLNNVLKMGRSLRQREPFPFSTAFDESPRLYFALDKPDSVRDIIQNTVDSFNHVLPEHLHLSTYIKDNRIWLQKRNQEYRPYAFFQTRHQDLRLIKIALDELPLEGRQELAENLKQTDNYKQMVGSETQKGWLNDFKEKYHCSLKKSVFKETLFYQLKDTISEYTTETIAQNLNNGLIDLINIYQKTLEDIDRVKQVSQHTPQINDIAEVNTIIFTIYPHDISRVSTYVSKELQFCTGMHNDEHYLDTGCHIGLGSMLVVGVNSARPTQKLARIWIRPYRSKTGDVMYKMLSPKGDASPAFVKEAETILQKEIQPNLTDGIFYLDPRIHRERKEREQEAKYGTPPSVSHFSTFQSWANIRNIPYTQSNEIYAIQNPTNQSVFSTGSYFVYPKKLDLSAFPTVTLTVSDLTDCEQLLLTKQGELFSATGAHHFPKTLDLTGFKRIGLERSDLENVNSLLLPTETDYLNLSGTKNITGALNLSGCRSLNLEKADLSRLKCLILPQDWNGSLIGVTFPEKVMVEDVLKNKGFNIALSRHNSLGLIPPNQNHYN